MPPRFAPADGASRPLHVVSADDLLGWLAMRPQAHRDWLTGCGIAAGLGEVALVPGDGGPVAAVVGHGTAATRARTRFALARAAAALPAGNWHLEADLLPPERDEAALGWLLAEYRFNRYAKAKPAIAHLVAPPGCDAARLEAIAAGEWLTRAELEAVVGAKVYGQDVDLIRDLEVRELAEIADGVRGSFMRVNIFKAL
jgi:leucyl aminopeptidase